MIVFIAFGKTFLIPRHHLLRYVVKNRTFWPSEGLLDLQGDKFNSDRAVGDKISLVLICSFSSIGLIGDNPYWSSTKNSFELIELSRVNKVSLVRFLPVGILDQ